MFVPVSCLVRRHEVTLAEYVDDLCVVVRETLSDRGEDRTHTLGTLLFRATHTMNVETVRRLRARGWVSLKPAFIAVLGHLDTEGTTVSTLAERTGTTRQAVSQLTQNTGRLGLLERATNRRDARSVVLRHTGDGRRILLDAIEVMTEIEGEYAALIGTSKTGELKKLLVTLLAEIDPRGTLEPE